MTTHNMKSNDEFLRRTFDFIYSIDLQDIRQSFNRIDRRTRWLIVSIAASALLLWVVLQFTQVAIQSIEWANRPSLQDRLAAPYNLDARTIPQIVISEENPSQVLPATLQDFTLQDMTATPSLLEQCLISANGQDKSDCTMTRAAQFSAMGAYLSTNGQTVDVIVTQFADDSHAAQALLEMYRYSRTIGRVGNYALVNSRAVDYFYSSTREQFAFSWSNGPWVYTANSTSFATLEQFMEAFAY